MSDRAVIESALAVLRRRIADLRAEARLMPDQAEFLDDDIAAAVAAASRRLAAAGVEIDDRTWADEVAGIPGDDVVGSIVDGDAAIDAAVGRLYKDAAGVRSSHDGDAFSLRTKFAELIDAARADLRNAGIDPQTSEVWREACAVLLPPDVAPTDHSLPSPPPPVPKPAARVVLQTPAADIPQQIAPQAAPVRAEATPSADPSVPPDAPQTAAPADDDDVSRLLAALSRLDDALASGTPDRSPRVAVALDDFLRCFRTVGDALESGTVPHSDTARFLAADNAATERLRGVAARNPSICVSSACDEIRSFVESSRKGGFSRRDVQARADRTIKFWSAVGLPLADDMLWTATLRGALNDKRAAFSRLHIAVIIAGVLAMAVILTV